MPFGGLLTVGLISAGSSIAGSVLSGKPKTSTSTNTSTPTLSPELQGLQDKLLGYSGDLMDNPSAGLQPLKTAATDNINRGYGTVIPQLMRRMSTLGYGSSGKTGNLMFQTDIARQGDLSNLESQFAQMILNQQNQGANLGMNLLNSGRGISSTSTLTGPNTMAANGFMSAGNGLENLSTLLILSKILGQSGGGSVPQTGGVG